MMASAPVLVRFMHEMKITTRTPGRPPRPKRASPPIAMGWPSLYATPEWKGGLVPPGRNLSLDQLLKARYWVRSYGKPILLAEVGINAPREEKRAWFRQALADLPYFPEVVGWIYFNQRQPAIVPLEIGFPNWGLTDGEATDLREVLSPHR